MAEPLLVVSTCKRLLERQDLFMSNIKVDPPFQFPLHGTRSKYLPNIHSNFASLVAIGATAKFPFARNRTATGEVVCHVHCIPLSSNWFTSILTQVQERLSWIPTRGRARTVWTDFFVQELRDIHLRITMKFWPYFPKRNFCNVSIIYGRGSFLGMHTRKTGELKSKHVRPCNHNS